MKTTIIFNFKAFNIDTNILYYTKGLCKSIESKLGLKEVDRQSILFKNC